MQFLQGIKSYFKAQKQVLFHVFSISALITSVDFFTKSVVFSMQQVGIYVCSFFNILKVKNYGVSFGILNEGNHSGYVYLILVLEVLITMFLIYSLKDKEKYKKQGLFLLANAFIIGGALGNIIDRLCNGYVRDFLDFHIGENHWPCFNVADIFICVGVGIWIICELFFRKKVFEK